MSQDRKMDSMPMQRLLLTSAVPMMLSLLFSTLYNTVDGIFVSRISEQALTAISLSAPIQLLISALGNGIAVGMNAVLSRSLGEKNQNKVRDSVESGLLLAAAAYIIIALAGILLSSPFFTWQSPDDPIIADLGKSYLSICMLFSFGNLEQYVFDRCLISNAKSTLFLISLGCASGINLILDPILIFGAGFIPAMGIRGAAIATVIGQIGGACISAALGRRYNREVPVTIPRTINRDCIREIMKTGIPTALMNGGVSAAGVVLNSILISVSPLIVAIYGIWLKVQNLALVGVHGICLSLIPIVAYNLGAKNHKRMRECLRLSGIDSMVIFSLIALLLVSFPQAVLALFSASPAMLDVGIPALRLLTLSCWLSVPAIIISHYCQAVGRAVYSLALTLLRQAVILIPMVLFFVHYGSGKTVWFAYVLTELSTLPIVYLIFR